MARWHGGRLEQTEDDVREFEQIYKRGSWWASEVFGAGEVVGVRWDDDLGILIDLDLADGRPVSLIPGGLKRI